MLAVQIDTLAFTRWLDRQARQQVPFAAARALTNLAKMGQQEIRGEIQRGMIVRRNWVLQGVQVKAAQKRDGLDGMQAEVGSRDWYMAQQLGEQQVTRKADGKKQFLPKAARKSPAANISAAMRPARVTQKALSTKGTGTGSLFFKRGRGGRSVLFQKMRGEKLRVLYTVGREQTIKPKASLNAIVQGVVAANGEREFIRQMQAAIKSARG